ncbi:MAG TPA: TIGR00282 family metallophosphoesterase [Firmicutes bacterium]|nr:TIGR00282 family metallophosphoesterase [Bacillota bacterium]
MRVLFIGDIVGSPGRKAVKKYIGELRSKYRFDYCVANGENAAGGSGITYVVAQELYNCGIHAVTMGNHTWSKREITNLIEGDTRLARPANYPPGLPGQGTVIIDGRLGVISLLGRIYMDPVDCPFRTLDRELELLKKQVKAVVVDIHAEATSEKIALGWFLDGRVACVVGTHTHVQTADERILPEGTGYISDLGMTGPINSVLGVKTDIIIDRFLTGLPKRFLIASGPAELCGAVVTVDDCTGKTKAILRIREAALD